VCLDRNQTLGPAMDPGSDAIVTVLAGEAVFQVDAKRKRLEQWASVLVPAGSEITVTNASVEPLVLMLIAAPPPVPGAEGGGPARPQAYNGSTGSIAAAVSVVFSGPNSPIRDIGFVAITPQQAAVIAPNLACSCTVQLDCPE